MKEEHSGTRYTAKISTGQQLKYQHKILQDTRLGKRQDVFDTGNMIQQRN